MQIHDLPSISNTATIDLARECVYRFLSAASSDPYRPGWDRVLDPASQALAIQAADVLREAFLRESRNLTFGELAPENLDLATLIAELGRPVDQVRGDYDRVFGLVVPKECPPYETEYHPPAQAFLRSQQMADIAGFYRAFGLTTPSAAPERPDHLVLELEFMAVLLTKMRLAQERAETSPEAREQTEICARAQRGFLRDHLCWWVPAFASGLRRKACCGYLHELGIVLAALIPVERHLLAVEAPLRAPAQPELIERPEGESGCETCPLHVGA
jgi:TorA maturation chaperone TorD